MQIGIASYVLWASFRTAKVHLKQFAARLVSIWVAGACSVPITTQRLDSLTTSGNLTSFAVANYSENRDFRHFVCSKIG